MFFCVSFEARLGQFLRGWGYAKLWDVDTWVPKSGTDLIIIAAYSCHQLSILLQKQFQALN